MKKLKKVESTESKLESGNVKKTDKQNSSKELFERIEVEKTPFQVIVNQDEDLAFGIMGNYRITETCSAKQKDLLVKELKKVTWNRLVQVITILQKTDIKIKDDE